MARSFAPLRRALTLWLAVQMLAGSLAALANAQPLWSSFLQVLDAPACIDPRGDYQAPAQSHQPACILCLALGGAALATLPAAATLGAQSLTPRPLAIVWPESQHRQSWTLDTTRSCRGPPPAA